MTKEVATVDLDDLVIPSAPAIVNFYNAAYGTDVSLENFYSHDPTDWGVDHPDVAILRVYDFYGTDEYAALEPTPEAIRTLTLLADFFALHISTGRPDFLRPLTEAVLDRHLPGVFEDVHFTNYASPSGGPVSVRKSVLAQRLNARWHADDHVSHAVDVAGIGITSYLVGNYPWSQVREGMPGNVVQLNSLEDLAHDLIVNEAA